MILSYYVSSFTTRKTWENNVLNIPSIFILISIIYFTKKIKTKQNNNNNNKTRDLREWITLYGHKMIESSIPYISEEQTCIHIFFALVKIKATNYQDASGMIWLHKQHISTKKNSERNRG